MTSDLLSFNHMIYEGIDSSKIGQWYLVVFFSHKIIPAEIQYKIHNQELLVIVEAFKT